MKRNIRFFVTVAAIILASSVLLTGCMHVIASEYGGEKKYDMGSHIFNNNVDDEQYDREPIGDNCVPVEEAPDGIISDGILADDITPQESMQKKFSAMYDISEDGKTITVISKEYLSEFWQSNYQKEVIHSLTTEEVYFIIQDSIRIYREYEKIILTGFNADVSDKAVAERFPCIEDDEIFHCLEKSSVNKDEEESAIYSIIIYRLRALSSPKAFFTGEEAMRFVGEEPEINSTMLPWTVFYIPCYSESTNRDYVLFVVGYSQKMNSVDLEDEFSDLFGFCNKNGASIFYKSKINEQLFDIFPTEGIYKKTIQNETETNKGFDDVSMPDINEIYCYFKLAEIAGRCSLIGENEWEGIYTNEGDAHILTFDGDFKYVLYCNGDEYVYAKGESNPIPGYEFEDGQLFTVLDGYVLIPVEN